MKKIILTGGGTAGHVTPNLALVPRLKSEGFEIYYVGGKAGVEKELVAETGIPYYGISAGKLRRYFNLKNFTDVFRVLRGFFEALAVINKIKPDVIFSKGGFVAVPVVAAGWLRRVPAVIHEADLTLGLANRLSAPFAKKICCAFFETLGGLPDKKAAYTGTPIRGELFAGETAEGLKICGFTGEKPVILVMGGSLGSVKINNALRASLPELLKKFDVAHVCGAGNTDASVEFGGYAQFGFVKSELPHLFAAASAVVSRAGANSITELLALNKPALLIPLPLSQSRGDQIKNAELFLKNGFAKILREEELSADSLTDEINKLYSERESLIANMEKSAPPDGAGAVTKIILDCAKGG